LPPKRRPIGGFHRRRSRRALFFEPPVEERGQVHPCHQRSLRVADCIRAAESIEFPICRVTTHALEACFQVHDVVRCVPQEVLLEGAPLPDVRVAPVQRLHVVLVRVGPRVVRHPSPKHVVEASHGVAGLHPAIQHLDVHHVLDLDLELTVERIHVVSPAVHQLPHVIVLEQLPELAPRPQLRHGDEVQEVHCREITMEKLGQRDPAPSAPVAQVPFQVKGDLRIAVAHHKADLVERHLAEPLRVAQDHLHPSEGLDVRGGRGRGRGVRVRARVRLAGVDDPYDSRKRDWRGRWGWGSGADPKNTRTHAPLAGVIHPRRRSGERTDSVSVGVGGVEDSLRCA